MTSNALTYFVNLALISILVLPLYHLCKSSITRSCISIFTGLWMLFILAPQLLLFWPPYWLMVWLFARASAKIEVEKTRSTVFAMSIFFALLPMLLWKLDPSWFEMEIPKMLHAALENIMPLLAPFDNEARWAVPVGLSFTTFRALDFLICVHLELIEKPRFREVARFGFFAPILFIGPVVQFQEITDDVEDREKRYENIVRGILRVAYGFAKLLLLANPLASSQYAIVTFQADSNVSQLYLIGQTFLFAWYLYFNFSAYSDIAVGFSRMYGFKVRENFNFPYFRSSLPEYWSSWHMSLTSFCQRNVFIPLGGFRKKRQYFAVFMTMMTIALWHGLTIPMVVFGLFHSTGLIFLRLKAEYFPAPKTVPAYRTVFGTGLTFSWVALALPLILLTKDEIITFYQFLLTGT